MSDNLGPGDKGVEKTESNLHEEEAITADGSDWGSFLRRQLPYLAVLGLAIVGVAYTNMAHQPLVGYWEFFSAGDGRRLRLRGVAEASRRARPLSVDLDSIGPLGGGVGSHEHHVALRRPAIRPYPGDQPDASAFAGARYFPCRTEFIAAADLLFGSVARPGGARGVVAQTVDLVLGADRCLSGWTCSDVVAQTIRAGEYENRQRHHPTHITLKALAAMKE